MMARWSGALLCAAGVLASGCRAAPAARDAGVEAASETRRAFWGAYGRAGQARAAGDLDAAVPLYREALAIQPDHEDGLYYLGTCLLEQGHFQAALEAYRRLVHLNPSGSSRAHMQIGAIHASLDPAAPVDLRAATIAFQQALDVDPDSGALLGLAEVAVRQGRVGDAERLLRRVEADNPMSIAAPFLRGYLAYRARQFEVAWEQFTTAVRRGEMKKGPVRWTEEGDVKDAPELRWRALARQSVFGAHWIGLRSLLAPPGPTRTAMRDAYDGVQRALGEVQR